MMAMAKPRKPWNMRPAKRPVSVPVSLKAEVETKAMALIQTELKPRYVKPPKNDEPLNYVTDIQAKWFRNNFYFVSTYACPNPTAQSPTFEVKFARMEPLGDGTFALYAMRYTGKEWVGVFDALTVDECMEAIRDDPWFQQ